MGGGGGMLLLHGAGGGRGHILVDLALCYLWMAPNEATLIDITET